MASVSNVDAINRQCRKVQLVQQNEDTICEELESK